MPGIDGWSGCLGRPCSWRPWVGQGHGVPGRTGKFTARAMTCRRMNKNGPKLPSIEVLGSSTSPTAGAYSAEYATLPKPARALYRKPPTAPWYDTAGRQLLLATPLGCPGQRRWRSLQPLLSPSGPPFRRPFEAAWRLRANPDGFSFIIRRVLPRLKELGVKEEDIDQIMKENPRG